MRWPIHFTVLVVGLGFARGAAAAPLSEPELTVLCRIDEGKYRWPSEVEETLARVEAPPPKAPEPVPEAAPAPETKPPHPLRAVLESLTENLPPVCQALNARGAVPKRHLKEVTAMYARWSAAPEPMGDERNTVYAVTQVREQLLIGLSRGGSSRSVPASFETSLLQGTEQFLAKRATEELTLFMLGVLEDRLCPKGEAADPKAKAATASPFPNTCRVLTGSNTLPASTAALSRAARADFQNLSLWIVDRLATDEKSRRLACTLDVAQAFTGAARDGQPLFDVVSDIETLKALMRRPAGCKAELKALAPLMEATRLSRTYTSFSALRAEGSYDLLVSLATVEMPEAAPRETSEVLRRLDSLASVATSSRGLRPSASAAPRTALGALQPLLSRISDAGTSQALTRAMTAILSEDYPDAFVQLTTIEAVKRSIDGYSEDASRALGIAAELASADSSREVSTILEQSALPLGSWRRKNEPRSGLTLTGLVGIHVNRETVLQPFQGQDVASGSVLGAAAFLGVDYHYGFRGGRFGLFAPILDFGAMTSTRIGTASGESDVKPDKGAEVGIQQLLSPGGYAYLGFGPLVIGGGASWVPALRQVRSASQEEQLSVLRIGAFVAVDVSIVPLL